MTEEKKKEIATAVIVALGTGDPHQIAAHLAEEINIRIPQSLARMSQDVMTNNHSIPSARFVKESEIIRTYFPQGRKTTVNRVFCEGDTVMIEFTNRGTTAVGKAFDNDCCMVVEFAGDKIKSLHEYNDTKHAVEAMTP